METTKVKTLLHFRYGYAKWFAFVTFPLGATHAITVLDLWQDNNRPANTADVTAKPVIANGLLIEFEFSFKTNERRTTTTCIVTNPKPLAEYKQ